MEDIFNWLKVKLGYIYKGFLFLITSVIILYFFPREGKFPYEFQKNKPWLHETYFAPFDFPIYKTFDELSDEKDSLLKDFKPYFKYDTKIEQDILQMVENNFILKWDKYFIKDSITDRAKQIKKLTEEELKYYKDTSFSFIKDIIGQIYGVGIVNRNSFDYQIVNENEFIIGIRQNIATGIESKILFTPRTAYEYLLDVVNDFSHFENNKFELAGDFLFSLNLNEYIKQNLFYDESKTVKAREDLLNSILDTRGMVQEDALIISKGETINAEKHKILESLKKAYIIRMGDTNFYLILLGQIFLVIIAMLILYLFLLNFRREIVESNNKTTFILILIIIISVISGFVIKYWVHLFYVIPFAIIPIIILTFFESRLALFIHFIVILLMGFYAPNSFEFIFLNFITGIAAIFSLKNIYKRGKLVMTAFLVTFTYCIVYFGISITQEGNIHSIHWDNFKWFAVNGVLVLFSIFLIFIFEKLFGFLSDITLMELSETNEPLLRKLAEKAPGTFQHSLQVANLAEEAAISIDANPLLVRAGALYHDIGKIEGPVYFTENQISGYNPHEKFEYEKSAELIINHITNGVKIAKKHNLPKQIIDFITTHQGTAKVHYFYTLFKNKYPDKVIDINKFSYPGPKPFSKETAILMMADAVEAASKSLKDPSAESISDLVDNIINKQIEENQFDNATITFKDITTVKNIFKKKLLNIYHVRIEYPKENKEK